MIALKVVSNLLCIGIGTIPMKGRKLPYILRHEDQAHYRLHHFRLRQNRCADRSPTRALTVSRDSVTDWRCGVVPADTATP